jgi:hypothetical protein
MSRIRRDYVRAENWAINAKSSPDKNGWKEIKVSNVSANGILFHTVETLIKGDSLFVTLDINPKIVGFNTVINMKVKVRIMSERGMDEGMNAYGAEFVEISMEDQIRLDELVRMTIEKYGSVEMD